MVDAASDGSDSENDLNEIFGESSDEDDFGGFVFELPDDIEWEKDPNGAAFRTYYEENPRVVFQRTHCGPTVDRLPGNGKTIDIFSLFLSDEFLNKIARWTNRWFEVKKAAEPTKTSNAIHTNHRRERTEGLFCTITCNEQGCHPPKV